MRNKSPNDDKDPTQPASPWHGAYWRRTTNSLTTCPNPPTRPAAPTLLLPPRIGMSKIQPVPEAHPTIVPPFPSLH